MFGKFRGKAIGVPRLAEPLLGTSEPSLGTFGTFTRNLYLEPSLGTLWTLDTEPSLGTSEPSEPSLGTFTWNL